MRVCGIWIETVPSLSSPSSARWRLHPDCCSQEHRTPSLPSSWSEGWDFSVSPPAPSCLLLMFSPRQVLLRGEGSLFPVQTLLMECWLCLWYGTLKIWDPISPFPYSWGNGSLPGKANQENLRMLTPLHWDLAPTAGISLREKLAIVSSQPPEP